MTDAFTLFDTAIGRCAIAWNDIHLCAIQLPEASDRETIARVKHVADPCHPATLPAFVVDAIAAISAHLAGKKAELGNLPLDFARVGAFERDVLLECRRIPTGETTTYGAIARALGNPQASRAVGAALGRNPWPIVVPCHRVLAANGKLGGFSAPGGRNTKVMLLSIERAKLPGGTPDLFDQAIAAVSQLPIPTGLPAIATSS